MRIERQAVRVNLSVGKVTASVELRWPDGKLMEAKPARRSAHRTQWAAQFAVASELCKKGYEVAFTMGNHPSVDLMVVSPTGKAFGIDVKGLYRRNFWAIRAKVAKPDLFYVLAYVPDDKPNRYFILSQAEVNIEIAAEIERVRDRAKAKGKSGETADVFPGLSWVFAESGENAWRILPE